MGQPRFDRMKIIIQICQIAGSRKIEIITYLMDNIIFQGTIYRLYL